MTRTPGYILMLLGFLVLANGHAEADLTPLWIAILGTAMLIVGAVCATLAKER